MDEFEFLESGIMQSSDFMSLLFHFVFNTVFVWLMIHLLYYPKSRRREYYFTFMLISISVFFLVFLLGGVKIKIGFALGLFAIFGIIRYRTESMGVRDMTYLFVIIAMSVINALSSSLSLVETGFVNLVFLGGTALGELAPGTKSLSQKLVLYDRVELIVPERREELMEDLRTRLGLDITSIEIGAVDFLRDTVMIKVFYPEPKGNSVNKMFKFPKENE